MIYILWMRKWELREFKWLAQDYTAERHWAGSDPLLLPLDYRAEVEDQENGVLARRGLGSKGFEMGVHMTGHGWGPGWGEEEMLGTREKRNKCVFPASVSPAQLVHSGCSENVD